MRPLHALERLRNCLSAIRADLARQAEIEGGYAELLLCQGTWATVVYRLGQCVYALEGGALVWPGKLWYRVASKLVEVTTGIKIPASAVIGPGLHVGHFGGIILHSNVVAGERLNIGQGVTIGTRGQGDAGVPRLGNNVYLGAGAKVLGPITIGDNVSVGANAVVVSDLPSDCTAVGVPARIVRRRGTGAASPQG